MKLVSLALCVGTILLVGCGHGDGVHVDVSDQGVKVQAPGVEVNTGEGGAKVIAPGVNVEAGSDGTNVTAPGVNVEAKP
jgi:hypothetical protein